MHNEEAGSYRVDFYRALVEGGWEVKIDVKDEPFEGIQLHLKEPHQSGQKSEGREAVEVLQNAFKLAGIRIDGTGSGSGVNITETTITLRIGRRRMDDNAERNQKQIQEQIKSLESELRRY